MNEQNRACPPWEQLADHALGTNSSADQLRLTDHLRSCLSCRREIDGLNASIAAALPAVPAASPPLGFEQRVVAQLTAATRQRRRPLVSRLVAAAAAILLLGAGVVAGRWWSGGTTATSGARIEALRLTDGGEQIGDVVLSRAGTRSTVTVTIVGSPTRPAPTIRYTCRLRLTENRSVDLGTWMGGPNVAWVVPLPRGITADDILGTQLVVEGTDRVWAAT